MDRITVITGLLPTVWLHSSLGRALQMSQRIWGDLGPVSPQVPQAQCEHGRPTGTPQVNRFTNGFSGLSRNALLARELLSNNASYSSQFFKIVDSELLILLLV